MTNTALLEEYIQKSGLKKKHIAEQLGLTAYSFAQKVNNVTEFKASEIIKLCEILSIDSDQAKNAIFFAAKVD